MLTPGPDGRPSSLPPKSAGSRSFSGMARRLTGFGVRCGRVPASPELSKRSWASVTTAATSADCSWTCTGRPKCRFAGPSSRDEGAIRRWRNEVWPDLRRRAHRERRVLVFEDESGFYLLPSVVRTYAPEARTPVLHEVQTRDHISVMGGMTPEGKIYTWARQESLNGLDTIEFLWHLGQVVGPRLLVIWDGSPIHRREEVNDFVSETRGKIALEALPGYAPDLNPWDEGGWHHLKDVEMANLVCRDLEELHQEFHLAVERLRQKPHLVQSFFAQAGLKIQ